jgi:UDP-N-acetylglucosamine 2-epimerase
MLNFAGVLIRTSTERPEVLDKGTIVVGGITTKDITQALDMAVSMRDNQESTAMPNDYLDTNVSTKVVRIIQSYAKIVDMTVWGKGEKN